LRWTSSRSNWTAAARLGCRHIGGLDRTEDFTLGPQQHDAACNPVSPAMMPATPPTMTKSGDVP
jgi:hypothetical protein